MHTFRKNLKNGVYIMIKKNNKRALNLRIEKEIDEKLEYLMEKFYMSKTGVIKQLIIDCHKAYTEETLPDYY